MATNVLNSSDDLATIFNDCLERMAAGQSLDDCLAIYPRYAVQLRALLETRAAVKRARATPQEVYAAQERIRFRLQGYSRRSTPTFDIRRISGIAVLLLVLLLAGFGVQRTISYLNQPTLTITATASTTVTSTVTGTSTPTPTTTATPTQTLTFTPSTSPTATDIASSTMQRTPLPRATQRPTQPTSNPPNPPPPTDDHGGRGSDDGSDDHGGDGSGSSGSGSGQGGGDD